MKLQFIVASLLVIAAPNSSFAIPKSSSKTQNETRTVQLLMTRIRAQLPAGWKTTYDSQNHWLAATRIKPVLMETVCPNMPNLPDPPTLQQFEVAFRVVPFVSPADYKRLKANNEKTQNQLTAFYTSLFKQRVPHKYDGFLPRNAAEKTQVDKYNLLKKSLHDLPDFFFHDIALEKAWGFNSLGYGSYVTDAKERDECDHIARKTTQLLTPYEPTS